MIVDCYLENRLLVYRPNSNPTPALSVNIKLGSGTSNEPESQAVPPGSAKSLLNSDALLLCYSAKDAEILPEIPTPPSAGTPMNQPCVSASIP